LPCPSSTISTSAAVGPGRIVIAAWRAPLWRITFVAPSRTAQASTDSASGVECGALGHDAQVDPGRLERHPRPGQLACQRRAPIAVHGLAHLSERAAGQGPDVVDLPGGCVGAGGKQLPGELRLQCDEREVTFVTPASSN
jgi:hypothetical protein